MFRHICAVLALLALAISVPLTAQVLPGGGEEAPEAPSDPLGRETPRGAVNGLLQALAQRDYERAARYLKPSDEEIAAMVAARAEQEATLAAIAAQAEAEAQSQVLGEGGEEAEPGEGEVADEAPSNEDVEQDGAEPGEAAEEGVVDEPTVPEDTELPIELSERAKKARTLQVLLDQAGKLTDFSRLSADPQGDLGDGYPANIEKVGVFQSEEEIPILLSRSPDEVTGILVWRVSRQTISDLDRVVPPEVQEKLIEAVDEAVPEWMVMGAPLADWVTLVLIGFLWFFALYLLATGVLYLLRRVIADPSRSTVYQVIDTVLPPLCLLIAVAAYSITVNSMSISIIAAQNMLRLNAVFGWVSVFWFAIRLTGAVARAVVRRLEDRKKLQSKAIVSLAERAAKILIIAVGAFAILDTFGFDVTTGIAALGIGGLAFALGAQKTIENLVGSVTVIADRPVDIGDFCEVGGVSGTVEDIGIRSTRLRTMERTLVSIPNADFSSQQINNYSERDRFLFNPTIGLEYGTDAAGMKDAIRIIKEILDEHEKTDKETNRVLFSDFSASSLDIAVFTYLLVADFAESLHVRHDLLMTIHEKLGAAGYAMAFPTQTVHLARDGAE